MEDREDVVNYGSFFWGGPQLLVISVVAHRFFGYCTLFLTHSHFLISLDTKKVRIAVESNSLALARDDTT